MAQVKKVEMREAIIESAFDLFRRKGYTATTVAEIAKGANMTVANLYVYFEAKIAILYAVYRPWLERQLQDLASSTRKLRSSRSRVRRIIIGMWSDIPAADHSFANSLIEALATVPLGAGKSNDLLNEVETFIGKLLAEALPPDRQSLIANNGMMSHVLWMAFDGFVINQHVGDVRPIDAIADMMADLLLGE